MKMCILYHFCLIKIAFFFNPSLFSSSLSDSYLYNNYIYVVMESIFKNKILPVAV